MVRSLTKLFARPRRPLLAVAVLALFAVAIAPGCQPPPSSSSTSGAAARAPRPFEPVDVVLPTVHGLHGEPALRVRIAANVSRVELRAGEALIIGPTAADRALTAARRFAPPVHVEREAGRFRLTDAGGRTLAWGLPALEVRTASGGPITIAGVTYPGSAVLLPWRDNQQRVTDQLDVINHVPLEQYLPGVLAKELYASWDEQAFAAQAIAARSYALFERQLNAERHYDLESTTASQVYGGQVQSPKAHQAVRQTRGQIVVYQGRVVPAFYSSCCGGAPQSSAAAFPHLGGGVDIAPLRGSARQSWCQSSSAYRWGPIQRGAADLARRIAAWGAAQRHAVAQLDGLTEVRVGQRSASGRPSAFVLRDRQGRQFTMAAELFRFACNHHVAGLPELTREQQLRSSHVEVRVVDGAVHFTDGRGFGHGVGLCQWGAQGMARAGYTGSAIAEHFYPGATVQQVY